MRRGLLLSLLVLVLAFVVTCTSSPDNKPAMMPPTPETSQRCRELDTQLDEALAAVSNTCETDADCQLIGGQIGEPTCDCAPFLVDCGGLPMPTSGPGADRVNSLLAEFRAAGCATGTECGCNIRSPLKCSTDNRCVADRRTCTVDEIPTGW